MRTLELRRHSFTKKGEARGRGSHLSIEGVRAAREVGPSIGAPDLVVASTSPRTLETAIAMGFAVDDLVEMPSPVETGEVEFHSWRAWPDPFTTLRTRARESRALGDYIAGEVERLLAVVDRVGDGGRILVVGHGGWLESVVAGLLDPHDASAVGGSFWHLDGVRLAIDADAHASMDAVHRFPQQPRQDDGHSDE
jgi:broad specificity phosphatase PhoE